MKDYGLGENSNLGLLLNSMILGEFLSFYKLESPHLYSGDNNSPLWAILGSSEIIHIKTLAQCLAHGKCFVRIVD